MTQRQGSTSGPTPARWASVVVILLLAWALRLCYLEEVPPGWRDDELINIHALSGQVLEGHVPIYYLGASGHEPLYHHLHAVVHALLGFNVLSGHILSVMFGTLSIALTYSVVRRLFPEERPTALIASLSLATSFWSLMYSRTAIRHMSLPPLVLATVYAIWRRIDGQDSPFWSWWGVGLLSAGALYTYTASRLLPVVVVAFGCYLALVHRDWFHRCWRGMVLALLVTAALAAPLGLAIAQGRSARALEGVGADARVTELAGPLRALYKGNPEPLLQGTWRTLGMFHVTGDPEWLYNIPGRPVFNLLGGALLWAGVGLCLSRWRRPRCFFLILWLGLGLVPAFVSVPAASLSHTILAQPTAYILPAVSVIWIHGQVGRLVDWCAATQPLQRVRRRIAKPTARYFPRRRLSRVADLAPLVGYLLATLFLTTNAARDLRDYFVVWPQRGMVRLLYRADYRQAAQRLNAHSGLKDVAISSGLFGPWDRLALGVDVQREDIAVRLFDPERALISATGEPSSPVILTSWPDPAPLIRQMLESERPPEALSEHLTLYPSSGVHNWQSLTCDPQATVDGPEFDNGLALTSACWNNADHLRPGEEGTVLTVWHVVAPLDLPPLPVVANPPPPGVYSGPRLAVFAHLLDEHGALIASDDGLWVDPLTLQPGDRFIQLHRLLLPADAPDGPYTVELGLYDPRTGERWKILRGGEGPYTDRILLPSTTEEAPRSGLS